MIAGRLNRNAGNHPNTTLVSRQIPKVLAMIAVMMIAGPWMLGQLEVYTQGLYSSIPDLVGP